MHGFVILTLFLRRGGYSKNRSKLLRMFTPQRVYACFRWLSAKTMWGLNIRQTQYVIALGLVFLHMFCYV